MRQDLYRQTPCHPFSYTHTASGYLFHPLTHQLIAYQTLLLSSRKPRSLFNLFGFLLLVPWVLDGQAPDIEMVADGDNDINLEAY